MQKLHELYLKRHTTKKNQETDLINYNSDGRIVSWFCWSEFLNDWVEVNLLTIKASYPSTFEEVEQMVQDDIEYRSDDIDHKVDCDRDDALTRGA